MRAQPAWLERADGGRVTTLRVPHAPLSVQFVRRCLRTDLESAGLSSVDVDDAEIVASELVSNAIRHARPDAAGSVTVGWRLGLDLLTVYVIDGGSPLAVVPRAPADLSGGGRGLLIVSGLSRAWGVVEEATSRTVWAALAPAMLSGSLAVRAS